VHGNVDYTVLTRSSVAGILEIDAEDIGHDVAGDRTARVSCHGAHPPSPRLRRDTVVPPANYRTFLRAN
jgi:hypothetical protein